MSATFKAVVRTSDNAVLAVATSPQEDVASAGTFTVEDLGPAWDWGDLLTDVTFDRAHPFASWFLWDAAARKVTRRPPAP